MSKHKKTREILDVIHSILVADNPMTVRQVYYQLVSRQVIKNDRGKYQAVSNILVWARQEGLIPWEWVEDRLRRPRSVGMWDDLVDFGETVLSAYRRNVWEGQPSYLEVWLEKDALSGVFEDVLKPYGVTLNVARGYDGWDSIHNAARRYQDYEGVVVLYFGDFDPFGDFDLIFGASKLDLKIVEIPIHYKDRTYGTTNISRFKHGKTQEKTEKIQRREH